MKTHNARLGLAMFFVYLLLYGGFVLLSAFSPQTMEGTPVAGINVAILYGFGLIAAAFVLALLYGALCKSGDSEVGAGIPEDLTADDVSLDEGGQA